MSRIEEALRRARSKAANTAAPAGEPRAEPAAPPPADAFKSPWNFQPSEFDRAATPAGPAETGEAAPEPILQPAPEVAGSHDPEPQRTEARPSH